MAWGSPRSQLLEMCSNTNQSLLLFALRCVCLSPAWGTDSFLEGFTGWSSDLCQDNLSHASAVN